MKQPYSDRFLSFAFLFCIIFIDLSLYIIDIAFLLLQIILCQTKIFSCSNTNGDIKKFANESLRIKYSSCHKVREVKGRNLGRLTTQPSHLSSMVQTEFVYTPAAQFIVSYFCYSKC